jgi:hypothetical protein
MLANADFRVVVQAHEKPPKLRIRGQPTKEIVRDRCQCIVAAQTLVQAFLRLPGRLWRHSLDRRHRRKAHQHEIQKRKKSFHFSSASE